MTLAAHIRPLLIGATFFALLVMTTSALAWGSSGHRLISELALKSLPAEVPDFLRKAEAARQVSEVSREPDRAKGASAAYCFSANRTLHICAGAANLRCRWGTPCVLIEK